MQVSLLVIIEAAILASSLSLDAFTAGFAYGTKKIELPPLSVQVITLICSIITGLALFAGSLIKPYLPVILTTAIAFTVLFIIGVLKLIDGITKSIITRHNDISKEIKLSMFNFKFILNLYADPEKADVDASKVISPSEAAALALSLSLDGIAVGFGAALVNVNGLVVFFWSLVTNTFFLMLGHIIGIKIAQKLCFNLSWLSGAILILLAFSKLR